MVALMAVRTTPHTMCWMAFSTRISLELQVAEQETPALRVQRDQTAMPEPLAQGVD